MSLVFENVSLYTLTDTLYLGTSIPQILVPYQILETSQQGGCLLFFFWGGGGGREFIRLVQDTGYVILLEVWGLEP